MKNIIFIPLLIFLAASIYVFVRGWQILPQNILLRIVYIISFLFLWSAYIIGMVGKESLPVPLVKWFCLLGGTFWVVIIYLVFILLAIDILRIINHFFHFFPSFITGNMMQAKWIVIGAVFLVIAVLLGTGYYRFSHPEVKKLELEIDKQVNGRKELNIVAVSDLHLGFTIGKKRLQEYIRQINDLHPDIVLIAGDLIDISARPLEKYKMYEDLQQLRAPLGVYMVTGNHEYISGIKNSLAFIEKTGIRLLQDEKVSPDSTFILVGQSDLTDPQSKTIPYILKDTLTDLPVICISHQPQTINLQGAVNSHVDFLFCGHTHLGQVWPGNKIVERMYEVPYGYKKIQETNVYVSSGLGIWGPQFRIGTQSELIQVKLKFQ